MSNNIAVSITVDTADLVAKRAVLSAELKAATGDLNNFAKTAAAGGTTDALKTSMLASATAVSTLRHEIKPLDAALSSHKEKVGSTREAYEALRITQDLLGGDFDKAGKGVLKLTEHFAAHEEIAKLLEVAMSPLGLSIAAVAGVMVAGAVAASQYEAAQQQMETAVVGMGAASGQSKARLEELAEGGNNLKLSIGESEEAVTAFAKAGVRDSQVIEQLKGAVADYAALTGQTATEATKDLAEAMRDPAKGAEDLNQKLSFLDASQLEQIRTLSELSDKTRAQELLSGLLRERTDEAATASGHLQGGLADVANAAKDAWRSLGGLTDQLARYEAIGGGFGSDAQVRSFKNAVAAARGNNASAEAAIQRNAQLDADSAAGAKLDEATPEGREEKERSQRQGDVNAATAALKADVALYGAHSAAVQHDQQRVAEYTRALTTYRSEVEKKVEADKLDVEISKAKEAHNHALVADLTRQKSLISQAGVVETDADANALASGAGDVAGAKGGDKGAKKAKDDQVQVWRSQLQTQLEDEKSYFASSKAEELKFWNERLGQTKKGSADERAVKTEIYNLDRDLAKQGYDDQIATLNDQLEAAKDNWGQEQRLWLAKLAYIGAHYGAESQEYKQAHREFEADERTHQAALAQIARDGNASALAMLKENLDSARAIRDADARQAEASNEASAKYAGPMGEVNAARRAAVAHQQMLAQQLADDNAYHAAQDRLLQDDVNIAKERFGEESAEYKKADDAKRQADTQFANQHKALEDQIVNQAKADAEKIKAAWHATIDPMVNVTGEQIKGLVEGTETWSQALRNVGESAISAVVSAIERMVEAWIVNMIVGKAATSATGQSSVASYAAIAGAAGTASMAGAPFPLDLTAPSFGASMSGAAMGFGARASAAGGYDIPAGVNPLLQAHAEEMVLPAHIANPMRSMLSDYQGGMGAAGGGVNITHAPVYNGVGGEVRATRQESNREFTTRVEKMHRRGVFKSGRR
jgi:hypothetical protein